MPVLDLLCSPGEWITYRAGASACLGVEFAVSWRIVWGAFPRDSAGAIGLASLCGVVLLARLDAELGEPHGGEAAELEVFLVDPRPSLDAMAPGLP